MIRILNFLRDVTVLASWWWLFILPVIQQGEALWDFPEIAFGDSPKNWHIFLFSAAYFPSYWHIPFWISIIILPDWHSIMHIFLVPTATSKTVFLDFPEIAPVDGPENSEIGVKPRRNCWSLYLDWTWVSKLSCPIKTVPDQKRVESGLMGKLIFPKTFNSSTNVNEFMTVSRMSFKIMTSFDIEWQLGFVDIRFWATTDQS